MKYLENKSKRKFKLNIVGNGQLYKFLNENIKKNNLDAKIKIIRNVTNPTKFYLESDFFILSSLYEGLPNALIEAISFKKISLSSNCPTGPREILLNGKALLQDNITHSPFITENILYTNNHLPTAFQVSI